MFNKKQKEIDSLKSQLYFAKELERKNEKTIAELKLLNMAESATFYIYVANDKKPIIVVGTGIEENWTSDYRSVYIFNKQDKIALITKVTGWKKEVIK